MAKREPSAPLELPAEEVGRMEVFDRDGNVIWTADDFVAGHSQIPPGLSVGMGASRLLDRRGKVIRKWDPWGILQRTP